LEASVRRRGGGCSTTWSGFVCCFEIHPQSSDNITSGSGVAPPKKWDQRLRESGEVELQSLGLTSLRLEHVTVVPDSAIDIDACHLDLNFLVERFSVGDLAIQHNAPFTATQPLLPGSVVDRTNWR
jgi:hypothetical protein